jgi:hypothetical protein
LNPLPVSAHRVPDPSPVPSVVTGDSLPLPPVVVIAPPAPLEVSDVAVATIAPTALSPAAVAALSSQVAELLQKRCVEIGITYVPGTQAEIKITEKKGVFQIQLSLPADHTMALGIERKRAEYLAAAGAEQAKLQGNSAYAAAKQEYETNKVAYEQVKGRVPALETQKKAAMDAAKKKIDDFERPMKAAKAKAGKCKTSFDAVAVSSSLEAVDQTFLRTQLSAAGDSITMTVTLP